MKAYLQTALSLIFVGLSGAVTAPAQTAPAATPTASAPPTPVTSAPAGRAGGQAHTQGNLSPGKDWPKPVDDEMRTTFVLADVLEFHPNGDESDFRWDFESWHGGDFNRLWLKTEGEQSATRPERNFDLQLLYGRFVKKYYDVQIGARADTRYFRGASVTRGQAVVGIEGLVPYRYEVEAALFVSHQGDVSGRFTFARDFLVTQRLVLQARFETNIAAQRVERFGVGSGLNDIEPGLRLRYEIRRKFGPYVGVTYDRSFFGTADLQRQEGGAPGQWRFVAGVRVWR